MRKDYKSYKIYLDEKTRCYTFMVEIINFYKGLIDIWYEAIPDDLSPLLSIETFMPIPGTKEQGNRWERGEMWVPGFSLDKGLRLKPNTRQEFSDERAYMGLCMFDKKRIKNLDFTNSIDTAKKISGLLKTQKREDIMSPVLLSSQEIVEFIGDGLLKDERFVNPVLKWILKPSFYHTIEKFNPPNPPFPPFTKGGRGGLKGGLIPPFDKWGIGGIWRKCPLCNSPPGMALVDATEQRLLSCCFCGFRWFFDPIACPACVNNKPERIGFFAGESGCDQGTRAVSCEECKSYIKTVFVRYRDDGRDDVVLDMDIEDAATIPIDIIANERGYRAICQQK